MVRFFDATDEPVALRAITKTTTRTVTAQRTRNERLNRVSDGRRTLLSRFPKLMMPPRRTVRLDYGARGGPRASGSPKRRGAPRVRCPPTTRDDIEVDP